MAAAISQDREFDLDEPRLKINEIFYSLQGETSMTGWPTVFIRLSGCPLRCVYCDTEYAFYDGDEQSIQSILSRIEQYKINHVTVTGGEPLAQRNCLALLNKLCDTGYLVSLETSGAMDIAGVDDRVVKILDLKTPASGEENRNRYENLQYLNKQDEIKFVICDRSDYNWAGQKLKALQLDQKCTVLFSPAYQQLSATDLADWILEDQLSVRFQMQLHKLLWGEIKGK